MNGQPMRAGVTHPVGTVELAELFGVSTDTAKKWKQRGAIPPPRWTVSGVHAWDLDEVLTWAHETGRADRGGVAARVGAAIVAARAGAAGRVDA